MSFRTFEKAIKFEVPLINCRGEKKPKKGNEGGIIRPQ